MFLCIWDNGFRERKPTRNKEHPDRIQIAFDDHRLVNNPGLLLPATLAQRVGLRELVDHHLDLGDAPGRANAGDKVSLADRAVRLTNIEYRLLFELSVNAGRVLTHEQLLQRVWGPEHSGQPGAVRTFVKNLRRKLGDDADTPTYIFTEPRVGYRMPRGEGPE